MGTAVPAWHPGSVGHKCWHRGGTNVAGLAIASWSLRAANVESFDLTALDSKYPQFMGVCRSRHESWRIPHGHHRRGASRRTGIFTGPELRLERSHPRTRTARVLWYPPILGAMTHTRTGDRLRSPVPFANRLLLDAQRLLLFMPNPAGSQRRPVLVLKPLWFTAHTSVAPPGTCGSICVAVAEDKPAPPYLPGPAQRGSACERRRCKLSDPRAFHG
jgi:hypothetical protein